MSLKSKLFEKIPIEIQKRNGFDLSHINCGTCKTGQMVPVLKRLLMPSTMFSLGASVNVELPALATSFFGRVDFCIEVFFCPCSILYGGFKQFISNQLATMFPDNQQAIKDAGGYALPLLRWNAENINFVASNGTALEETNDGLLDYLGWRPADGIAAGIIDFNMLPFLAYHRICDVYYRNTQVTKTWFAVNPNVNLYSGTVPTDQFSIVKKNVAFIWHSFYTDGLVLGTSSPSDVAKDFSSDRVFSSESEVVFPDGVSILSTRQRPWARDYFTSALLDPQQGSSPAQVEFAVDGDTASFSIPAVRAANSVQKFLEANNLDMTYDGNIFAHFGVRPSDAGIDEPMYLGRLVIPVYQKSVYNSQQGAGGATNKNPFAAAGTLGAKGAHGDFIGEGSLVDHFKVTCFGYLMALASLVPHTMYNYGIDKDLLRKRLGDFPFPELQSVGMEGIKRYEIYAENPAVNLEEDFAYTQRYAYEKYINDSSHGELRPGKSLESFVLQRVFDGQPEFGTEFTLIPQDALDMVFATNTATSKLSCWYEIFWEFKASMPLAEYCIPTLGDLKDTYTTTISQGGSRL